MAMTLSFWISMVLAPESRFVVVVEMSGVVVMSGVVEVSSVVVVVVVKLVASRFVVLVVVSVCFWWC